MPLFAVICRDKPEHLQLRKDTRETHLAFLGQRDNVKFAGPFIENDAPCGSLLIVEGDSIQAVRDWAAQDPYAQAGLFASTEVIEWRQVIG